MAVEPHIHTRTGMTVDTFKRALIDNLAYVVGKEPANASPTEFYTALAISVRDRMLQRWFRTQQAQREAGAKRVCYLSAEYLLGPQLGNNLLNEELTEIAQQALAELGHSLGDLAALEIEPGLGNGGLGRLAACFLDSLATLEVPAVSYGIRYEFGIFRQTFVDGWQVEVADDWLARGSPWEMIDHEGIATVGFGGSTAYETDAAGQLRVRWMPEQTIVGVPHNYMVPGYGTDTVNTLRLWRARATAPFDLGRFNTGDYTSAVAQKTRSENISKVLYPDDTTPQGKQLRLEQQYFFVACSLADTLREFRSRHDDWNLLPEQVAIQLNDTHPTIAVAELMRLLVDGEGLPWAQAWSITGRTLSYTVHTLLPEALEEWPVALFAALLPRHLEIIYEINARFLAELSAAGQSNGLVERVSIIRETPERRVRMAYLATVGGHAVNGVAALQSGLLKELTLRDFYSLMPQKFTNVTNGVTPRRFMKLANPPLAALLDEAIGTGWLTDLEQLRKLEPLAEDAAFRARWRAVKRHNKEALAVLTEARIGLMLDSDSLFDVMVKRLHEYKRQLLNVLHIVTLYRRFKADPGLALLPRTCVFGAKAAPGYRMAKLIIRLINGVAATVNSDAALHGRLRVAFLPNFNVNSAERIYPAADLSEQISLAGKEASGTGNMKFALNGALTIGTLDGANVEIRELVGAENFFLFGLSTPEVFERKQQGYVPQEYYERDEELRGALDLIASGHFAHGDAGLFQPIVDSLRYDDQYMLLADYRSYIDAQAAVEHAYHDQEAWARMSILNTARCGFFSSDRSMRQYCADIWGVQPVAVRLEA